MPDTGENHEIRQRVNAREAEIEFETTKLVREEKAELKNVSSPSHHSPTPERTPGGDG
jgi:hypothetical protein